MSMDEQCMKLATSRELHSKTVLAKVHGHVGALHILRALPSLGMGLDGVEGQRWSNSIVASSRTLSLADCPDC